jgi:ribonuclease J
MEKTATEFVLYAGLRTIGGVIASVTYGKSRVIFEFGTPYDPAAPVFDQTIELRPNHWIGDLLKMGQLPGINGLYRRADLGEDSLVSAEESGLNTAVFITHLHLDHMALMGAIAPQIPVYLHRSAQIIERALEATGQGVPSLLREYSDIEPFQPVLVGEIEVLPILCRDTGYCDFAFLITTPDGTIHWTGDLFLHSVQAEKSIEQMKLLKARNVDVLLCDATAFMDSSMEMVYGFTDISLVKPDLCVPENMMSERQRIDEIRKIIAECRGLCVFNYYPREMDDADMLMQCANGVGRRCVFEPEAAYIVYRFFHIKPDVFLPDADGTPSTRNPEWLNELLEHCTVVTPRQIAEHPVGYLLQNSYKHLLELFSLPAKDGVYIHMGGAPAGEFDPAYQKMCRIVETAGFAFSAAQENYLGHSYPGQVKYFVDIVDPKVLIPCHSKNPERLLPLNGRQLLPELGKTYLLDHHRFYPQEDGAEA